MSESSSLLNSLTTPQIVAIVAGAAAILWYFTRSSNDDSSHQGHGYPKPQPPEKLERLPVGKLTLNQIKKYTGKNKTRIFISVCGRIFDCTKGRDFYGPDGPYGCFTGGDASYMLGAMSLEPENKNKTDFEQDGDHQITLSDWISRFRGKYPIVGRLEGFDDLCPESWREAGNDDIIDNININNIYENDFRVITMEELNECSNFDNNNAWISVCGIVFNVKSAEIVYESMYGDFVDAIGNDISVALCNEMYNKDIYNKSVNEMFDINNDQHKGKLQKLKKYLKLFVESYPIVGFLKDNENKYRINNLGDISEEWSIVDQNEANDVDGNEDEMKDEQKEVGKEDGDVKDEQ
eukprot:230177_1